MSGEIVICGMACRLAVQTARDMSGDAIEVLKLFTEDLMELVFIMGGQFFRGSGAVLSPTVSWHSGESLFIPKDFYHHFLVVVLGFKLLAPFGFLRQESWYES